ncbi:endonuclease domain-containing protein [Uliginosibacterium flavum]|uniref:DUF559 domain-containing protein n=1 Tax=Uliginosibacterium flavum TaxID=1396831 RepID=A0ABV2TIX9_9RHOO
MLRLKPSTTTRSRALRLDMTLAERLLWRALREQFPDEPRFRRQHPVGNYIVDFACIQARLVIELDGGQHAEALDYDAVRTHQIEQAGFHVIRFWNNEVLENIEGVMQKIAEALTCDGERPA